MTKDNRKWECLGARSLISGINLLLAHYLLALINYLVKAKSIFYYSLIFFWVLLEAAPNVSDGSPIFFEKCMKSAGVWEISDTFNWKNTSTCFILILTEDLNNSSDLLSISRNFLQQNRLILVWMVWIIINFYIVFLQSDFFKQNIDFFFILCF